MIPAFVNPAAGNAEEVDRALRKAGCFDVRDVAPDEVTQAVQAAIEKGARRVAAVGGDGTVSAAAAAVARTDAELVVVPAGTFNHFARDYGIPLDLDAACANATSERVIHADVAWVNGRLFLNTSSVGAYANFVRVRERLEPRVGYWVASLSHLTKNNIAVFSCSSESASVSSNCPRSGAAWKVVGPDSTS